MAVKSGIARHGRALVSIILFQTLLILWLSLWAVEDYLNNQYVKAYVDSIVLAEGWAFGLVAFVGVLGSVMGLVVHRKRAAKTVELEIGTSSKTLEPSGSSLKSPILTPSSAMTKPAVHATAQTVELHPAVAALKAELSEARMSLGLASVTTGPQTPTSSVSKFDDQKPMLGVQPSPMQHSSMAPPRPQLAVMNQTPQNQMRPSPPTGTSFRPIPPTVIRPYAQQGPTSLAIPGQTTPVLRIDRPQQAAPAQPSPSNMQPAAPQPIVRETQTVITDIVPSQQDQKKKESDSANGQKTSSQ